MNKYVVLFPGQGAQYSKMGQSFYNAFPIAKNIYEEATKLLGINMESLCFEENDLLNQTEYTQKAIFVTSIAIYETIKTFLPNPYAMLGFSLGEYSAMAASNIFAFEDALHLVEQRSLFMEEASLKHPGMMVALLGGDLELLESFCKETTNSIGLLQIANYNSSSQYVLTGVASAFDHLNLHLETLKVRKMIRLNVSGAFHSPLMHEAALKMKELVRNTKKNNPSVQIVVNYNADYLDMNDIENSIQSQIEGPVYFKQSIEKLMNEGVDTFIEVGPGKVLTNLIKKINPDVCVLSINEAEDVIKLEELN